MKKLTSQIALITKIDHHNNLWLLTTAGNQWPTYNNKGQLTNALDEAYVAIAQIDLQAKKPHHVSAPLELNVSANIVQAHMIWCSSTQMTAQVQLWQRASEISDTALKGFLIAVLSDTKIMMPFYMSKASKSYHHNKQGELFIHSVEVAIAAQKMASQYNLPKRTQDCVFVGGLLHDIGKTMMFYNTGDGSNKGVNGQHESFNFMVLAEHLERLKDQDKTLFEAMSAMLAPQVNNKKYYDYVEELIVRSADRISAQCDELQSLFKSQSADQLFISASGGRKYKRLGQAQLAS